MNIILFDDISRTTLLPLTFTKPVAELRIGILKIIEKWEKLTGTSASFKTASYLSEKFPCRIEDENLMVSGAVIPDMDFVNAVNSLEKDESLFAGKRLLACRLSSSAAEKFDSLSYTPHKDHLYRKKIRILDHPWQIFSWNGEVFIDDFEILTAAGGSFRLNSRNRLLGEKNIFVEEGVKADFATINATTGPVYLSKGSEVMEGSVIRGPFFLGEYASVKLGAKIYGPTTIGPHSKVGGEVNNCVIQGFSNKAHDGFLGNSVIGEWCNIGADTNNSNLKNNYAMVRVWSYREEKFIDTGMLFCGLIMADHSKCGINTMFNTGTVVGVNANIFGSGFPRTFIPSFSWGGAHGFTTFSLPKAFDVASQVMKRRNKVFDETDRKILTGVFNLTAPYRK